MWRILHQQHQRHTEESGDSRQADQTQGGQLHWSTVRLQRRRGITVKEYQFTLRFVLPSTDMASDDMVEHLGNSGCDDALIGVGQGRSHRL